MESFSYKLIVAYEGTHYFGWQEQADVPTIAGELKRTFFHVFKKDIVVVGASRTDAGVHAMGQVVRITLPFFINPNDLHVAWNRSLPKTIYIRSVDLAHESFHPHHNVQEKIYWYHISQKKLLPFLSPYITVNRFSVDIDMLHSCLQLFVGTHDFRSFTTGNDHLSTIRRIDSIVIQYIKRYGIHRIIFTGPSFLRYMIRRIVGASLYTAAHHPIYFIQLKKVFAQKNPLHQFPTAPAQGLMLRKIIYK